MITKPEFLVSNRLFYTIDNGHLVCTCGVLKYITSEVTYIKFIHDTGAFISTLSRGQYELLDFNKIKVNA